MIKSVLGVFTNLYAVWVIGASIAAFFVPDLFTWFSGPWVTWALAVIMLGMGLTLSVANFKGVLQMPRTVALGFIAQYTVMPATAWVIASMMNLEGAFAVGLILVACCPGGTASNVVAFLARANVALSVVLTMVSTILAIAMTPLLMQLWAGHYVPIDGWGIFRTTLQVVLVPIVLGVFLNHRFPAFGAAASHVGPAVAVLAIVMIAGSIVANNAEAIASHWLQLAIAGLLLHLAGFVLGYFVTRAFRFSQNTARTVSIEVGMQNSGLAMVLAQQHFSAATATPAVFSSVFHTLVGSLAAAYWRLKPPTDETVVPEVTDDPVGREPIEAVPVEDPRRNIYYWKCDRPAAFHGTKTKASLKRKEEIAAVLEPILRRRLNEPELVVRRRESQGDHLTYLVDIGDKTYFVRVQDGPEEDNYMEIEAAVQKRVWAAGVPTPHVLLADASRSEAGFSYQVLEYFQSRDLNRSFKEGSLSILRIAEQIGQDVARWQSITPPGFGPFCSEALRDRGQLVGLHESYEQYFKLNWDKHLEFLVARSFLSQEEAGMLRQAVDDHAHLLGLESGCLVHKDLALWNILGTSDGIEAYIDWGDTIVGDPMDDLSLLACFHDSEVVASAMKGYMSVRALPEDSGPRFWLHLLRNMVVKATIRVGSGYFEADDRLFLVPSGENGSSFEAFTKTRLWAAYSGLCDKREAGELLVQT